MNVFDCHLHSDMSPDSREDMENYIIRMDNYIANSDYLVQLSDTEAWSYSVLESLCLGTPVIVTPIPCFIEMGIENGKNPVYCDNYDGSGFDFMYHFSQWRFQSVGEAVETIVFNPNFISFRVVIFLNISCISVTLFVLNVSIANTFFLGINISISDVINNNNLLF